MFQKIETYAAQLAEDIVSGKKKMNNLDIEKIGQSVLNDCSEEDINAFTNNMNKILPALTKLSK
jgi:hypothetical protein